MSKEKADLLSLTEGELQDWFQKMGEKKFRGSQVFEWVQKGHKSIDEMTILSKSLRDDLKKQMKVAELRIYKRFQSSMDETVKYLFDLEDGNRIEAVLMKYRHGYSLCISTQVGCAMGCKFCASTRGGLIRHLTAGEMIDQIHLVNRDKGITISNVVLMGIGEPLHNFDQVHRFLENVNHKKGLNISYRKVTLSTCGLVPEIRQLGELAIPINLAISLHAPSDEKRREIMPIAKKYTIEEVLRACREYIKSTNRRITFEYALVKDFNDQREDAEALAKRLKGILCHVNLIPVNPIDQGSFEKPYEKRIKAFEQILEKHRIPVTVRRELGQDIDAACGQLRNQHQS